MISERIKKQFGGRNAQSDKNAAEAAAFAERMRHFMAELGALSAIRAAIVFNVRGLPTAAGSKWTAVQVVRVRARLNRLAVR
jgi:hypothetical protein